MHEINLKNRMLPASRNSGFRMEGYWVWCGSVIKAEDGRYHMFASRWPKTQKMHPGWIFSSEIVRAVSDTPEGPYEFAEVVLPARGPQYWDGRMTHNPRIFKRGNEYVLYYIGTTHPFPEPDYVAAHEDPITVVCRTNKRIGIATADKITGPWKRSDKPVMDVRPEHFDNLFVSNPAPCMNEDGSVLMVYKSRAYKESVYEKELHGQMQLGVAEADSCEGPYRVLRETPLFPEDVVVEDPYIWKEDGIYHMVAKDMFGNVCGIQYGGIHAWSEDGVNWNLNRGELAYSRTITWDDGTEQVMGNFDRPSMIFDKNGNATHMNFAVSDGTNSFMDANDTWNVVIPLKPEA